MNLETLDRPLADAGHVDIEPTDAPPLAEHVARLARLGVDDDTIAAVLGTDARTVQFWRALQADSIALDDVAPLLYRHATGLEREVQNYGRTVTDKSPPDVRACMFWLRNTRPDQWNMTPDRSGLG